MLNTKTFIVEHLLALTYLISRVVSGALRPTAVYTALTSAQAVLTEVQSRHGIVPNHDILYNTLLLLPHDTSRRVACTSPHA